MSKPQITIQGEIHSSKNSRQIFRNGKTGKPFVAKSQAAKTDEESFSLQLACQFDTWQAMIKNVPLPIPLVFHFRRRTKARFDYVNMTQGILDAMVKAGYIPDDDADTIIPNFVPYTVEPRNPGCDVFIG